MLIIGAGEMEWCLGALAALPEEPGSIAITHMETQLSTPSVPFEYPVKVKYEVKKEGQYYSFSL